MSITAGDLTSFAIGMVELLIFLGYLAGFWKLLNVLTPDVDDHAEIFIRRNWPYLVQRLGISLAQAIGMLSSIGISSPNRWLDVLWLLLAGAWVTLLLFAVHPVVDRAVLRASRHRTEIRTDNLAVSMVKASFYVAFGFVVNGSLSGSAPNWPTALTTTVAFTLLGGAVLLLCYVLHDRLHPQAMREGVRDGKLPASFEAAGVLIALGLIMRNAIAGDFVGWGPALIGFGVTAVAGLVVLYVARWLIDWLMIKQFTLKEIHEGDQVTAAAFLAALLPLVAMPVTAVVGTLL